MMSAEEKRLIGYAPCPSCGRGTLGGVQCQRCTLEMAPTLVSVWLEDMGWTNKELAEATGLSLRTIKSARAGDSLSPRTAEALHRVTKLDIDKLIHGGPL